MSEPLLHVDSVHKAFGTTAVLRGVSLDVERGGVVCLIGASGSGKSTLLRCINGLEPVDAGSIRVDDIDVTDYDVDLDAVRRRVGIVFQAYNLFPHLSVLENVCLAPRKVARRPSKQVQAQARELLSRFGLADKADDYPDRLSGGQQQRVAIVRALAMEPDLLLLDEVTSALDPELVGEVLEVIRDLARSGMTMVLATHEMGFAREVASEVVFLDGGVVCEQGPPAQFFAAPAQPRTQAFLRRVSEFGHL
ncbi:MAG TPA: amino acid ABC transporter ATP-binding protein [Actinomycetes bacterium]|nr:amino acid ABC transporter ATP-binding protein [Actinomycetes bacterium]